MLKKITKSMTFLLLLAAVPAMADEPVMSKYKVTLGGYVKLDYANNSNAVGPISPGAPGGGIPVSTGNTKDESVFTAKQSRVFLKVEGPEFFGAKTGALIEADFYGANSLGNEFGNMRMRHAYGTLDWKNTQVLFGQFWDIFGIAPADTIDFRLGGTTGNPSNPRVPQVRLTQKVELNADNSLKFVLGVQNPVQDSATGVVTTPGTGGGDNSMSRTAAFGSVVNGAAQISFISKALGVSPGYMGLGNSPLTFTLFGLFGNEKIANHSPINVYGYGAYGFVPLLKSKDGKSRAMTLSLEAQTFVASGLDVQGATALSVVGPAIGASTPNLKAATGYGVYGQLKFYPTQDLGITGGYSRREAMYWDDYRNSSAAALALSANTTTSVERYNELMYGNITYDLNSAVRVATEFERMNTQYKNNVTGQNNTVRLAAYYFF